MINELKSELSGHFEEVILALFMTHTEYDAYTIHNSIKVRQTDLFRCDMCGAGLRLGHLGGAWDILVCVCVGGEGGEGGEGVKG